VKILKIIRKLLIYWLPGTDYSALRASPLRGRPSGVQLGLAAKLSNRPCFKSAVRIAAEKQALPKIGF
jgi:hypothetical protein